MFNPSEHRLCLSFPFSCDKWLHRSESEGFLQRSWKESGPDCWKNKTSLSAFRCWLQRRANNSDNKAQMSLPGWSLNIIFYIRNYSCKDKRGFDRLLKAFCLEHAVWIMAHITGINGTFFSIPQPSPRTAAFVSTLYDLKVILAEYSQYYSRLQF